MENILVVLDDNYLRTISTVKFRLNSTRSGSTRNGDVVHCRGPFCGRRDDECFTDSVVNAAFSHEGTYMAAADMAGIIKVWKLASKEVVCEFETSDITVRLGYMEDVSLQCP